MNNISDDLKKIMLAGIGAVATTAEKSKEVVDALVKKGELTVEQGKILNEELKHNIKEKLRTPADVETISKDLEKVNKEDLSKLKAKIEELEKGMENEQSE
ncbi:phasin family protein [Erysipelotrichaceae bacterium HCN-30851]